MRQTHLLGFTLIEILVVSTIIGVLAAIGAVSYTQLSKQSRDAKRKADLEQIRSAAEMYRSNNGSYPLPGSGVGKIDLTICSTGSLTDSSGNTYASKLPNDPKCSSSSYVYYYTSDGSTYTISSMLETDTTSNCTANCGTTCRYTAGPYGQTCP